MDKRSLKLRLCSLRLLALGLVAGYGTVVGLLLWRMGHSVPGKGGFGDRFESLSILGMSLMGATVLLVLYRLWKQTELHDLREQLHEDEIELDELRARFSELSNLFQVASTLNLPINVDSMLGVIVRRVVAGLKAQQASVMLLETDRETLVTRSFYGVESEFTSGGRVRIGEGIAGWAAAHGEPLILNHDSDHPALERCRKPHRNITSALCVPLMVDGHCVGVLNVNRIDHPDSFTPQQLDIVKLFADHVASVIERSRLMEQLGSRTQVLEADNARLSEYNRMKDAFLSTASHELKTPLTSVIAYAELLQEHRERLDVSQQGQFLGRLHAEAARLLGLIEDILDLSRLETGKIKLNLRPKSMAALVDDAIETIRPTASRRGIEVHKETRGDIAPIPVDEVKVGQVVINLLTNAVRYSPEGSVVEVLVTSAETGVRVSVLDRGPGVTPDEAERIFTLYGQGQKKDPKGEGLGIGLHLVKRIVEMHGGALGVEERIDGGSEFWIELPAEGATERAMENPSREADAA